MDDDDEIVVVTYERPSFPWEPSQMQADVLNLAADLTTRFAEFMELALPVRLPTRTS